VARNGKRLGFLPGWRIATYVVLAFNLLMLVWVISGAASAAGQPQHCHHLSAKLCNEASDTGTAVGVGILIFLWALGDVILGVIWLVTNRKKTRECPACGSDVKKGLFACRRCGFDFRAFVTPNLQQVYPPGPQYGVPAQAQSFDDVRIVQPTPTSAEVRRWARDQGYAVSEKGRVPAAIVAAFEASRA